MKNICLILILITFSSFGQSNFNSESYNITKGDLATNLYAKDSTANALVLYEYGKSYFHDKEFVLKTKIKKKIKIFNKEGYNEATITIPLYRENNRKEKIKNIIATTYNLVNGEVNATKVLPENIFEEIINQNYTLIKFTFPNVSEGAVLTYSYELELPNTFMFKYKDWYFQEEIPKLYSEYNTSIPANYDYHIKLVGGLNLDKKDVNLKPKCLVIPNNYSNGISQKKEIYADCVEAHYVMKNIPAFVKEDFMTVKWDYLSRIDYELKTFSGFDGTKKHYTKTWKNVDKEFKSEPTIGKQLKKSIDVEKLIPSEILSENDTFKKAKLIYAFLQKHYTWNNEFHLFKDVSIKDLIDNKTGNNTEINILLHNILKESGINVKPVLLSTRDNGFPTQIYPVLTDFNYLIVQATINNEQYFLDATDKFLSFGQLPYRCLNQYGRLLDFKNGSSWVDIASKKASTTFHKIKLKINSDSNLSGNISSKYTGYNALEQKRNYFLNPDLRIEKFENKHKYLDVKSHEIINSFKTNFHFEESYDVVFNENNFIGKKVYINPFVYKFFNPNPFTLQERTYPIDIGYKIAYIYNYLIDVDESFVIKELPKDQVIRLANNVGDVTFGAKLIGNKVNVLLRVALKKSIYDPEYYPSLKELVSKLIDIQNNSILILEKK